MISYWYELGFWIFTVSSTFAAAGYLIGWQRGYRRGRQDQADNTSVIKQFQGWLDND